VIITLNKVIPTPLRDKNNTLNSEVWNKEFVMNGNNFNKIIAPSGTGKTTLMSIVYGLRQDYTGEVLYNHTNINTLSANEISKYRQQNISIVFQDLKLFQLLTAFENIELKRVMQNPFCDEKRVNEMADSLGILHILHQPINTCSYGEQQRVAIIRALVQPFEILLMDEPFSHLDFANTAKAANLINDECKKRNAGFVLTDLEEDDNFSYHQKFRL
jgi:ABC-type lipoprotein export system ATPase subunit